jgi:hypothetical protein
MSFGLLDLGRLNLFQPVPTELSGDNKVSPASETLALRTNRIWSKGRVEYASLADTKRSVEPASETFVPLLFFVVKPFVLFCG